MTFEAAVIEVLRNAERPLSAREVAEVVVRLGRVSTVGKTPDATVSACLYRLCRDPEATGVQRIAEEGPTRGKRGTVRWCWTGISGK